MTTERFFPYRHDVRWKAVLTAAGVRSHHGVTLTEDETLRATFGLLKVETPLSNVDHTEISGPHRWWTAVGARLSFADDGLTFGTNHLRGICIGFVDPIPRVLGFRDHSALWVSVADPDGLADALGV